MTTTTPPDVEDPPMATACPMQLIVGVQIKEFRNQEGVVTDRKIALVLTCGCRYFLSMEPGKVPPQRGEPSHCRGAHGPFQAEELVGVEA